MNEKELEKMLQSIVRAIEKIDDALDSHSHAENGDIRYNISPTASTDICSLEYKMHDVFPNEERERASARIKKRLQFKEESARLKKS